MVIKNIAKSAITNKIIAIRPNIKLIGAAIITINLEKLLAYLESLDFR
jgi:hypothetical protein